MRLRRMGYTFWSSFVLLTAIVVLSGATLASAHAAMPDSAVCIVCAIRGVNKSPQPVLATSTYMEKTYSFCSEACKGRFNSNPQYWIELPLPRPAPQFTLAALDSSLDSLAAYSQRPVLLDFWASWCVPCARTMKDLEAFNLDDRFEDLAVIGVSLDSLGSDKVTRYLKKNKVSYPILFDRSVQPTWSDYGVKTMPSLFLIDRDGQIVRQWRGATNREEIESALIEMFKNSSPKN